MRSFPIVDTQNVVECIDVLKYWHMIEFFVPFDLDNACSHSGSNYCDVFREHLFSDYGNHVLPWISDVALQKANAKPGRQYFYRLYLLPFNKNELTKLSAKIFPLGNAAFKNIEFEERLNDEGLTCFAKLNLDCDGKPDLDGLSVSTLPWAMGRLVENNVSAINISTYDQDQVKLKIALNRLAMHISGTQSPIITDKVQPGVITAKGLYCVLKILQSWAGIEFEHPLAIIVELKELKRLEKKEIVMLPDKRAMTNRETHDSEMLSQNSSGKTAEIAQITKAEDKKNKDEDEEEKTDTESQDRVDILNSFFIEDLEKAINYISEKEHLGLQSYVFGKDKYRRIDLNKKENYQYITAKLNPKYLTSGRWPFGKSRFMSLMQQFVINECFGAEKKDIFSVNGPPGTGKTTMLQDIVAENIVRRAKALAQFENSGDVFVENILMSFNDSNYRNVRVLHPSLTGYEIVVVSSNNAAVENISKNLPLKIKLGKDYQEECSYLKSVAAKLSAYHTKDKVVELKSDEEPWGLVSVALGNARNRNQFVDRAFWGPEPKDKNKNRIQDGKYLTIWEWKNAYNGPSFSQAKRVFTENHEKFKKYLGEIIKLQKMRERINDLEFNNWYSHQLTRLKSIEKEQEKLKDKQKYFEQKIIVANNEKRECADNLELHVASKPHFFARLFLTKTAKDYYDRLAVLNVDWYQIIQVCNKLQSEFNLLDNEINAFAKKYQELADLIANKKNEYEKYMNEYHALVEELDGIVLPSEKITLDNIDAQLVACWQNETLNDLRTKLFISALKLHEAWLASVLKNGLFRDNIFAISNLLKNHRPLIKEHEIYIWQSFFMWIPVVSSTFASIARQFKNISANTLGWLLIDEAGQAIPQAAVGAIWRSKNVVAVGDPRQIEPVFTIPGNLIEGLARDYLKKNYEKWLPTNTSIQILADAANLVGSNVEMAEQKQWIGCPLLVHRRCLDPMFSVANSIAYDNKMYNARISPIVNSSIFALEDSCWFDVVALSTDKQYVEAQGKCLVNFFAKLYRLSFGLPDVYIISPFKRVKQNLIQLLKDINSWSCWLPPGTDLPSSNQLSYWCSRHIGTVHTFQGKESTSVVFVLGADKDKEASVNWASKKPNLLNVALTRAKDRIYIIGDYELWSRKTYFREIARVLPRVRVN